MLGLLRFAFIGLLVLIIGLAAIEPGTPPRATTHEWQSLCPDADSDIMEGVWGETRLEVLDPCLAISGKVHRVWMYADGDYNILLRPDPEDAHYLDQKTRDTQENSILVEVPPGTWLSGRVGIPAEGDHVRVIGAYVRDTSHGWLELHPAYRIEMLPVQPGAT